MSALGGANGDDGPGGVALIDHDTFEAQPLIQESETAKEQLQSEALPTLIAGEDDE